MHIEGEPVIAYCYIKKNGDKNNISYLTREHLIVKYKKRLSSFEKTDITGIAFEHKLLLFPLVIGGIMTPLSIHALLNAYGNPWLLLSLMLAGIMLMYYGWEGSSTMTVKTRIKDFDYFITRPTINLKAFAEFVQHYISDDERARMFYFVLNKSEWQKIREQGIMNIQYPLPLSNWKEMSRKQPKNDEVVLGVDPVLSNLRIIMKASGDTLQPILDANVPVDDIHEMNSKK